VALSTVNASVTRVLILCMFRTLRMFCILILHASLSGVAIPASSVAHVQALCGKVGEERSP
jgi:hypothetical protein